MPKFSELFVGRTDVHGTYTIPAGTKPSAKGKLAGLAATKREPVTEEMYEAHLRGEKRLGIIPIRPTTNDVMWVAMDVDEYKTKDLHKKLAQRIAKMVLPLTLTRTKSGGAHLWCFFNKPVSAALAREIAQNFLKKLNLKNTTEIFPKQETIREEDDGSWINLPYFGDTCKALDEDGETELTLDQFCAYASDRAINRDDIGNNENGEEVAPAEDGGEEQGMPPCIAHMLTSGIEEGGRDNALMHIGVYLIKAEPDNWELRLQQINTEFCHPPLGTYEIGKTIKSLRNKSYQYLCKQQPMVGICNRPVCLTRKFGVGKGEASAGAAIKVSSLVKIDSEEPIYRVTMKNNRDEERTFNIDGDTLFNYRSFQIAAMKATNVVLQPKKGNAWATELNELLATMETIRPQQDTQMHDRIVGKFKEWVGQYSSGDIKVLEEQGIACLQNGAIMFRPNDFLNIIDKQFRISRDLAWVYLHDWGVDNFDITISGKSLTVWRYVLKPEDAWYKPEKINGAF